MSKCQPFALGIAVGVVWAAGIFIVGLLAISGWGRAFVDVMASLYIGYGASLGGALIGAVWAAIDGFVCGALIGWVYNLAVR